jgi:hypothetical protein
VRTVTLRTVFERASILELLEDPEFEHNVPYSIDRDNALKSDHYFVVFVFIAESQKDGHLLLRVASTTVVGIQRYTTTRLRYQGVYVTSTPNESSLLAETLRAHFRADQEFFAKCVEAAAPFAPPLPWYKDFRNGAGDLSSPPEFAMSDPELEELEKLFNTPDTRSEPEDLEG